MCNKKNGQRNKAFYIATYMAKLGNVWKNGEFSNYRQLNIWQNFKLVCTIERHCCNLSLYISSKPDRSYLQSKTHNEHYVSNLRNVLRKWAIFKIWATKKMCNLKGGQLKHALQQSLKRCATKYGQLKYIGNLKK